MKLKIFQIISMTILLLLPVSGSGAELGTRQRTITPVALATNTTVIFPSAVSNYAVYGYSSWQWGPGENEGRKFDLMPIWYALFHPRTQHSARLLSFLSLSDAHITDKESPCQAIYTPIWAVSGGNPAAYSPVMLYTTQVLDAAIRTANAVNRLTPFDFAISLGDDANGPSTTNSAGLLMSWTESISLPAPAPTPEPTPLIIRNPSKPPDLTLPFPGMQCSAITITSGWGECQPSVPTVLYQ